MGKGKVVSTVSFNKPTLTAAEDLLGCFLCCRVGWKVIRLEITEVEAYDGPADRASHAHRGKTTRNAPMFGEAGRWYVYFTYGMHWMLNIVTGPKGYPAAVLIRGGVCRSQTSHGSLTPIRIDGSARLTKFLKIDKRFNNKKASRKTGLWIEQGTPVAQKRVQRTPRIGVEYAGPVWSRKPYRFVLPAV